MKRVALSLTIFLVAALGFAQEMPAPEELKKLDMFHGSWKGSIHGDMEGQKFEGAMTSSIAAEGMFVKVTNTMDIMGMKLTEVGYIGWDADKKKYSCHWFTNFGVTPRVELATVEGSKFVSLGEPWKSAGSTEAVSSRSTLSIEAGQMQLLVEFKMGDKWVPAFKGSLKKA